MTDLKFTPGPWSFHPFSNPEVRKCPANGADYRYAEYWVGAGDKLISRVDLRYGAGPGGYPTVENEDEFHANAHLIAAAPDLFAALESIAEYWNRDQNEGAMADACWHAIETAEAALAKARGEQVSA